MGWKNTLARKPFDKASAKPEPITIFGLRTVAAGFQSGLKPELMNLTRHHVIPHSLLIAAWDRAVDLGDMDLIKGFAVWAGMDPLRDLPATFDVATPNPQIVLRKVAWNPFNIVIGPLSEHRVEDPGSGFDQFEFRSLVPTGFTRQTGRALEPKQLAESVARQEFNRHLGVLRRIYNILVRYTASKTVPDGVAKTKEVAIPVAPQDITSLITLLRSDLPERYTALGAQYRTGALLSPDLWADYSTNQSVAPESEYLFASGRAKGFANKRPTIVPWSAATWLPEVDPGLPVADILDTKDYTVWAADETSPTPPDARLLLSSVVLGAMDEAQFRIAVVQAVRKAARFKARALLFGPPGAPSDMARWTASELKRLNREGYDIKIGRTTLNSGIQEVRIYDFL